MVKQLILGIAIGLTVLACPAQDRPQLGEAQQNPQGPRGRSIAPAGTLTGTVYCADTNLPARLAAIYLVRISEKFSVSRGPGVTDLEGRFALNHVREGNYYVVPVLPGYVNLLSSLAKTHLDAMTADERKNLLAQVPSATISASQPVQLSIRLERGAEIDGTVTFDDGSPAIGARMSFKLQAAGGSNGELSHSMAEQPIYFQTGASMTDDRGHFRILGVPPGEYVVSASVPGESAEHGDQNLVVERMEASISTIEVFVGGGLRASKAETIKVTAGGASKDADITIPLSKLHTIRGQVVLKSTGQPPPAAMLHLLYADTKEPARMAIAPNGEFEIHYVPEGNFILKASASPQPLPEMHIGDDDSGGDMWVPYVGDFAVGVNGKLEGSGEIPLAVTGDMDGVSLAVPDPPPIPQNRRDADGRQSVGPAGPSDNNQ